MSFSNLKIGARLGLGFALVLALLAAVAGLGLASMCAHRNAPDADRR